MSLPCYDTAISNLAMTLHFVIPRLDREIYSHEIVGSSPTITEKSSPIMTLRSMSLPCYDTAIFNLAMTLHFVIPRLDRGIYSHEIVGSSPTMTKIKPDNDTKDSPTMTRKPSSTAMTGCLFSLPGVSFLCHSCATTQESIGRYSGQARRMT